jgi:hypothetical protein
MKKFGLNAVLYVILYMLKKQIYTLKTIQY